MAALQNSHYSFGRPFVDKPSFEGLPSTAIGLAQTSLLAADRAAVDWERVELLFERNWTPRFQPSPNAQSAILSTQNASRGQAPLYGAAAAPLPEPAFVSSAIQDSSPPKALPVPKRLASYAKEDGDDGPLPPVVARDPPSAATVPRPAEPLPAQPTLPGRVTPDNPPHEALRPQLGTWADRQYRLLDPVPERNEFGPGSTSGNSGPSSSHNNNSVPPVGLARNGHGGSGGVGSGSGGCGSGSGSGDYSGGGGSSSSIYTSILAVPTGSSVVAPDPLQKQKQHHEKQQNYQHHDDSVLGHTMIHGRAHVGPHVQNGVPQLAAAAVHNGADGTMAQQQRVQPIEEAAERQMDAEAMIQEAAWRWRFTRRWQAEQARTGPEQASASAPRDQMEEALAYLQATNGTTSVSMQIANVSSRGGGSHGSGSRGGGGMSMDGSLMLTGMPGTLGGAASTLGGDWPLAACGSGSGSFTSGPRILARQVSGELLAASREVASLNRRAAAVLQQQLDCELQADRRVQESLGQGPPWLGHFIPLVQIDEWGSFRFLMLKLRDQSARGGGAPGSERQRILIRGHNYGTEGQLMEECNREILSLAHKHAVPFEAPTCMGGGVMEWRRDRDRHLHLHSGFVMDHTLPMATGGGGLMPANGSRPASAIDLLNLAAALARQSFPPTYKITVLT
ncbi:hypothetical protein VOLCADRAFT_119187 [Volvox carteri f. nagariensis]|uniref:Uncharacterized protein n=1 Tax=Volvox carteri f. nagariensis TaxID=3068 RepID=D8UAV9_VOLCA|nr:uncharacterized protein VOLCADRAFT_119187 [Volvox carteri f. nagariensis]EFJ43167.1 hypothetical protein VOLCADRAFT_119187 [Volvox carteri f. nagariensis]|eukprot:XP_002955742.1 hypothetical protein VOLCADRAFT_119187 [Volvox carteri f. nagariensis]